jgi:hypothetical protein
MELEVAFLVGSLDSLVSSFGPEGYPENFHGVPENFR